MWKEETELNKYLKNRICFNCVRLRILFRHLLDNLSPKLNYNYDQKKYFLSHLEIAKDITKNILSRSFIDFQVSLKDLI